MTIQAMVTAAVKCAICGAPMADGCPDPVECTRVREARSARAEKRYLESFTRELVRLEKATGVKFDNDVALLRYVRRVVTQTRSGR